MKLHAEVVFARGYEILFRSPSHCKPLQSNGSGNTVKKLPFAQKCRPLTVITLQNFHCNNSGKETVITTGTSMSFLVQPN